MSKRWNLYRWFKQFQLWLCKWIFRTSVSDWYNFKYIYYFIIYYFKENNPCIPNPCQNGGFCDRRGSDVFCICNGFFGQFCEMNRVEMSTPNLQLIPTMSWLTNATDTLTGSDHSSKIGLYLAITGACLAVVATAGGIGLLIHNKDSLHIQYFLQSFCAIM